MQFEINNFSIRLLSLSNDLRTNQWEVTSKCCHKTYKPDSTMMAHQTLECPKCGKQEVVNYNTFKSWN